jgi:hypothetical protein
MFSLRATNRAILPVLWRTPEPLNQKSQPTCNGAGSARYFKCLQKYNAQYSNPCHTRIRCIGVASSRGSAEISERFAPAKG